MWLDWNDGDRVKDVEHHHILELEAWIVIVNDGQKDDHISSKQEDWVVVERAICVTWNFDLWEHSFEVTSEFLIVQIIPVFIDEQSAAKWVT